MGRPINQEATNLIKSFEGLELTAYRDMARKILTIGYGHTGSDVTEGLVWTLEQAEQAFLADVDRTSTALEPVLRVKLNDNQYGALVSLAYNVGCLKLLGSPMLRLINMDMLGQAAQHFPLWDRGLVNGVEVEIPGLKARRVAEQALWLKPMQS